MAGGGGAKPSRSSSVFRPKPAPGSGLEAATRRRKRRTLARVAHRSEQYCWLLARGRKARRQAGRRWDRSWASLLEASYMSQII